MKKAEEVSFTSSGAQPGSCESYKLQCLDFTFIPYIFKSRHCVLFSLILTKQLFSIASHKLLGAFVAIPSN